MTGLSRVVVCLFTLVPVLFSQQSARSRAEEIEEQRGKKAAHLTPEVVSNAERNVLEFREKRILEKLTYGIGGLRARFGALVTDPASPSVLNISGMTWPAGTCASARLHSSPRSCISCTTSNSRFPSSRATTRFSSCMQRIEIFLRWTTMARDPNQRRPAEQIIRLEDTDFSFASGVRPNRQLRMGATGGFTEINVGPGTNDRFASTDQTYAPSADGSRRDVAVGIDRQTDFLSGGVFAQYDYRDIPGGPRKGGNYIAKFTYNLDSDLKMHSHRRLELEAQQYIPFFNERRVIALRARSELTYKNRNQTLPFYMQPTLGGSNDLRGFRPYRFYDDNLMVFNAEYRYEIFSGMDMAIFGDAGKVFRQKKEWDFDNLEASYGIGMRFNARNTVFLRLDAGFSHEGFQVWLKFNNVF